MSYASLTFTPADLCGMFQIKAGSVPFCKLRVESVKYSVIFKLYGKKIFIPPLLNDKKDIQH